MSVYFILYLGYNIKSQQYNSTAVEHTSTSTGLERSLFGTMIMITSRLLLQITWYIVTYGNINSITVIIDN